MVVKRAVPISTLELQSRVEHAGAMATRRSRSSLRDDDIDDEVVMSWRSPLRGDEMVAALFQTLDTHFFCAPGQRPPISRLRQGEGASM